MQYEIGIDRHTLWQIVNFIKELSFDTKCSMTFTSQDKARPTIAWRSIL